MKAARRSSAASEARCAAGRRAEQADALGIDLELARAAAHELHGRQHVLHGLRKRLLSLFRQPVADREQDVAALGEIRAPILEGAARAGLPATAVHGDQRRKRPAPFGQIEIAGQRHAVMGRVSEAGAKIDSVGCHFVVAPR